MGKQIHNLVLCRKGREPFGFRIIGGKDEGLSFKVEKVMMSSPAYEAGLQERDFLISVQGKDVFDCKHQQVVSLIREAGNSLNISIERGDHIVPNFEEIWPSSKSKEKTNETKSKGNTKGVNYVLSAMNEGLPGNRDSLFTTVGKPKVEVHQYDNPINCYSDDVLKEMSEKGSWKLSMGQVPGGALGLQHEPQKFTPQSSAVIAVMKSDQQQTGNFYGR